MVIKPDARNYAYVQITFTSQSPKRHSPSLLQNKTERLDLESTHLLQGREHLLEHIAPTGKRLALVVGGVHLH